MVKKEQKKDKLLIVLSICKGLALVTPLIVSFIVLIGVFHGCFPNGIMKVPTIYMVSDNTQIEIALAILGVAVTVWIGLSIYNAIERKEVDEVKELQKQLEMSYTELKESIIQQECNQEYLESFISWYETFYALGKKVDGTTNEYIYDMDLVINTDAFVDEFLNLECKCDKCGNTEKIPYHKQFNLLIGCIVLIAIKYDELKEHIDIQAIKSVITKGLEQLLYISKKGKPILTKEDSALSIDIKILYWDINEQMTDLKERLESICFDSDTTNYITAEITKNFETIQSFKD